METKDFVRIWPEGNRWSYSPGAAGTEMTARMYIWNNTQADLLKGLQEEINEGWKPITEVGPSAFKLRSYTVTEHDVSFLEVVFWFLTFGLTFLFSLLTGFGASKRIWYEATEFSVAMMKE
jgi:hypothetical protein